MTRRLLTHAYGAIFHASRAGRAAEVAAWSNGAVALAAAGAAFHLTRSWPLGAAVLGSAFFLLRLALASRWTLWIPACLGTAAVAGVAGAVAWVFGHVLETPGAASIVAIVAALGAAAIPAWAYGQLADRRARDIPDSLLSRSRRSSLPPSTVSSSH